MKYLVLIVLIVLIVCISEVTDTYLRYKFEKERKKDDRN